MFSETPSRIIVSFDPNSLESIRELLGYCPFEVIGTATGGDLNISIDYGHVVYASIAGLEDLWQNSLERALAK